MKAAESLHSHMQLPFPFLFDSQGRIARLCLAIDISSGATYLSHEKNRYERRFQENLEGIAEPLILIDRDMKVKMINGTAAEYYGITEYQDAIGLFCHHAFKGRSVPCEGCEVAPAVLAGESVTFERKGIMDPDRLERVVVYPVKD